MIRLIRNSKEITFFLVIVVGSDRSKKSRNLRLKFNDPLQIWSIRVDQICVQNFNPILSLKNLQNKASGHTNNCLQGSNRCNNILTKIP